MADQRFRGSAVDLARCCRRGAGLRPDAQDQHRQAACPLVVPAGLHALRSHPDNAGNQAASADAALLSNAARPAALRRRFRTGLINEGSREVNSRIVLIASTVSTSIMMVRPVSRSIAPWMLRRSRPLLCSTATGTSFGAQQPTGRTAWVGCTASAKITASSVGRWFSWSSYVLMNAACFAGSSLRETAFGLRC